jgi:hypothetical protein
MLGDFWGGYCDEMHARYSMLDKADMDKEVAVLKYEPRVA